MLTVQQQIKEAQALLANLKTQVISLLLPKIGKGVKITIGEEKGNIIIYGLQRMPYCFYLNQAMKMQQILNSPEFAAFIAENQGKLAVKEKIE